MACVMPQRHRGSCRLSGARGLTSKEHMALCHPLPHLEAPERREDSGSPPRCRVLPLGGRQLDTWCAALEGQWPPSDLLALRSECPHVVPFALSGRSRSERLPCATAWGWAVGTEGVPARWENTAMWGWPAGQGQRQGWRSLYGGQSRGIRQGGLFAILSSKPSCDMRCSLGSVRSQ